MVIPFVAVGVHATMAIGRGVFYGAVAAALAGSLVAVVPSGVPRPDLGARRQRRRSPRPVAVLIRVGVVAAGVLALWLLGAPAALFTVLAAVATGTGVALAITRWWPLPVHVALATTTAVAFAVEFGWLLWSTLLLAGAVGWARVELKEHSLAQVASAAAIGFTAGLGVLSWLG